MEKVILQSPELVAAEFIYREEFYFQRLTSTMKWYVTYKNQIIAQGQYRNDLTEWIDITYPKTQK
jgi:stalled ribosome rescue protein Dom34